MKYIWIFLVAVSYSSFCLAKEDSKWFVGLGVGNAEYEESGLNKSDDLVSFSGGYIFNDIFSVEVGYIDLGKVEDSILPDNFVSPTQSTLSLTAKGFTAASKFSWQVIAPMTLSAKLGVSVLDLDKQWSGGTLFDTNLANDTGGTKTNIYVGVQLRYRISESLSFGLNWDRYEIEKTDIDGFYVKANIHF